MSALWWCFQAAGELKRLADLLKKETEKTSYFCTGDDRQLYVGVGVTKLPVMSPDAALTALGEKDGELAKQIENEIQNLPKSELIKKAVAQLKKRDPKSAALAEYSKVLLTGETEEKKVMKPQCSAKTAETAPYFQLRTMHSSQGLRTMNSSQGAQKRARTE